MASSIENVTWHITELTNHLSSLEAEMFTLKEEKSSIKSELAPYSDLADIDQLRKGEIGTWATVEYIIPWNPRSKWYICLEP